MKHKNLSRLLAFTFTLLLASAAAADVALFPAESTNLDEQEQAAIWALLSNAYQLEARENVLPQWKSQPAFEKTGAPLEAAATLGVSEYLVVSAIRLELRVVITASRYQRDGEVIHTVKMTAASLDDLEPVADRIAKALLQRTAVSETRTIDNVTARETTQPNRTFVEKVNGLKAGWSLIAGHGIDIEPTLALGFDARLEGRNYFLEVGVGLVLPGSQGGEQVGGIYTELGGSYYLSHTSVSPYIGGGVLPRLVSPSTTNLAVYAQTGLMFFRESSTRLYFDVRVAQNIVAMDFADIDSVVGTDNRKVYPTEFGAQLGIGW